MTDLDAGPGDADLVRALALTNYGHFTSMLVERGAVRGLGLHLDRLTRDCRRLFGTELDRDHVRARARQAVAGVETPVVVRVTVVDPALDRARPGGPAHPRVLVTTRPAPGTGLPALRLGSVGYERDLPQVKHVGLFGALWHRRAAQAAGFDDALFVDRGRHVAEIATSNIGFFDGERLVWPRAAALPGVTMRLLDDAHGGATARPVRLDELAGMEAAFATNAVVGVRAVHAVDGLTFRRDHPVIDRLRAAYAGVSWEAL